MKIALKTFNLDEEAYKEFSKHCKSNGISMSKKVENFIKDELVRLKNPELANFRLEIEKGTKMPKGLPSPGKPPENPVSHPMEKYC